MKNRYAKMSVAIAGVIVGVVIAFLLKAPSALEESAAACGSTGRNAMIVLGTVACAVFWWISAIVPDWLVGLGMLTVWAATDCCKFQTVFSQFGSSTVWLLVGAFSVAGAVVKTGALRRISLTFMRIFKPSFKGQVLSLMTVGTVISPLLPSATAKSVLGVNMAVSTGKAMKYPEYGMAGAGLFAAAWTGTYLISPCFLSASAFSYIILDTIGGTGGAETSWLKWFLTMLPWGVMVLVGMYFSIVKIYKPKNEEKLSKDHVAGELKAMGKMGKNEIISLVILLLCLFGWIFESLIGISAAITAIIGALLCFGIGVLKPKDIGEVVPWGLIIFIASVVQMGNMFSLTGISGWLSVLLTPVFSSVSNLYLLVAVIILLVYLIRMVLASQAAVITLFIAILYPIVGKMGVSPLILGLIVFTSMQVWFMPYQNSTYVAAFGAGEGYVKHGDVAKSCFAFCVISLLANLICIPYWQLLGYIK